MPPAAKTTKNAATPTCTHLPLCSDSQGCADCSYNRCDGERVPDEGERRSLPGPLRVLSGSEWVRTTDRNEDEAHEAEGCRADSGNGQVNAHVGIVPREAATWQSLPPYRRRT